MRDLAPATNGPIYQNLYLLYPGEKREALVLCARRHDCGCDEKQAPCFHYHATEDEAFLCFIRHRPAPRHRRLVLMRVSGLLFVQLGGAWIGCADIYDAATQYHRLRWFHDRGGCAA